MNRLWAMFSSHELRLNPEELHNTLEYYNRTHRGVDRNPKEWAATKLVRASTYEPIHVSSLPQPLFINSRPDEIQS